MSAAIDLVRRFRGKRVLVVGDAMLDRYYEGTASRLCPEGPVPVVRRTAEVCQPGGAGNSAANLAALGADVRLVGIVGADAPATALRAALRQGGVSDRWLVEDPQAATLHKLRILADGQYVVRFDEGETANPSAETTNAFLAQLVEAAEGCEAILVSDYNFGALSDPVLKQLAALRFELDVPLLVDSKNLARFAGCGATVVTPNHIEASLLVHHAEPSDSLDYAALARQVLRLIDPEHVAITLGKDGVLLAGRDGHCTHLPAHPVRRANDVGAGDTFAAAMTLALASGGDVEEAVRIGIDAAAIAITRSHTAVVEHQALLQRVSLRDLAGQTETGDVALVALLHALERYRLEGSTVVFTNGVFDILHAGHVEFLRQARELGDVLVVAVNSDRSARRLKGRNRPINSERDRLALITALGPVDHALLFDDDTPTELIRQIRPDVHVKGGDHAGVELPEAGAVREAGGEVVILPLVGNLSTSSMIDRIVSLSVVPEQKSRLPVIDPRWRTVRRVLAVRLDNLGDVLVTTPAIRAIRQSLPDASITLLASPVGAQVGRLNPDIDDVIVYQAPWMDPWNELPQDPQREQEMIALLAERGFDGAIIFTSFRQSSLPPAYLCYLAGIPLRVAASIDGPGSLLTTRHKHPDRMMHEVERGLDLVGAIGLTTSDRDLVLEAPQTDRAWANDLFKGESRPTVVVHPGCSMPARTYPWEMYAEVSDLLIERLGAQVFLTGAPSERELTEQVERRMRHRATNVAGELSFPQFVALIEAADLTVTNNTGPMHIAAAMKSPIVALFALTNPPEQWGPWQVPHRQLYHDVSCRICYSRICPYGHECLTLVTPDMVVDAAAELLQPSAPERPVVSGARR